MANSPEVNWKNIPIDYHAPVAWDHEDQTVGRLVLESDAYSYPRRYPATYYRATNEPLAPMNDFARNLATDDGKFAKRVAQTVEAFSEIDLIRDGLLTVRGCKFTRNHLNIYALSTPEEGLSDLAVYVDKLIRKREIPIFDRFKAVENPRKPKPAKLAKSLRPIAGKDVPVRKSISAFRPKILIVPEGAEKIVKRKLYDVTEENVIRADSRATGFY